MRHRPAIMVLSLGLPSLLSLAVAQEYAPNRFTIDGGSEMAGTGAIESGLTLRVPTDGWRLRLLVL